MSIDNRVVQMEFDNKKFESNAKESIGTIDRLKKSLNFEDSVNSLSNLEKAGNKFSLDGIGRGIDMISNRFTTMGFIGMTTIQNLTNSAINAGKQFVKSLTIDPVKTGLDEYETKMNAITTIMTNTASKGTTLEEVNKTLEDLNLYADQTIYNFAEMTRNIGTFTAAGIGLEDSATAIKGIANLAAGSGSTSQQASTAMYQLSQALAAGTVKLQDWNSVVNAGMGGELFQNALKKTAKAMGIVVNESVPFRESLQDGWITSEVLIKTLNDFAEDEMLLKAATQVKTFTQLIDTMKESVQSGWSQTWENIIGDKDEAASLFTALNDGFGAVVGKAADARNEMLKFWKENKGREYVIRGIANVLLFLGQVIQPIKDAWAEMFPPMTGKRLVELSKNFMEFASKLKIGESTVENIKRTFRGLFAVLDIGRQVFLALGSGLNSVVKYLFPAAGGFLSFTGSIGDYVVSLNEAIKSSNIFNVVISKIGNFMKPIADGVKKSVTLIIDTFKSFGSADLSGLDSFSDRVKARLEPFSKIADIAKTAVNKITGLIKKVAPVFYKLASIVGDAFEKTRKNILKSLDGVEFNSIFDLLNSGILVALTVGINKLVKSLGEMTVKIKMLFGSGGFLDSITNVLNSVRGSLEAFQGNLRAKTLLTIATAIAILAASLTVLSLINSEKLTVALTAISALFIELFAGISIFTKLMGDGKGFNSIRKLITAMIPLSVSILILSAALKSISKLEWDELFRGLVGITTMTTLLVLAINAIDKSSGKIIKGATGLIAFSTAILILTKAVKNLSMLTPEELTKGLVALTVILAEVALLTRLMGDSKRMISTGIGMIALGAAMLILASAIDRFKNMKWDEIGRGLVVMAGSLTAITVAMNLLPKGMITKATGLIALGAALLIISTAMTNFGNMKWNEIIKGLVTMAGALTIITVALKLMPVSMIVTSLGMVAIATALVILSNALTSMGKMSWSEIGRGLIVLAGSLTIISLAVYAMSTALPGAAALLIISVSLNALAVALKTMGSMNIKEIGLSLLALVGVFTVLGLAGLVLGPMIPTLLGLSASVALLGVAVLAAGAGLLLFSAGLASLSVSGAAGAAAIVTMITAWVGTIPYFYQTLAKGLIDFIKIIAVGIAEATPLIVDALETVINGILQLIRNVAKPLADTIVYLVIVVLETLEENAPTIIEGLIKLIGTILKTIGDMLYDWGFEAGMKLGEALDNMWTSVKSKFDETVTRMKEFGKNIIQGLINGIKNTPLIKAITAVGGAVLDTFKEVFGINSPSREGYELGEYISKGLGNGIRDNGSYPSFAAGVVGGSAMHEMAKSIEDNGDKPVDAASKVMSDVAKQFTTASFSAGAAGRGLTGTLSKALTGSNTNIATSLGTYLNDMLDAPKDNKTSTASTTSTTSTTSISDELDKISKSMVATDENAKKTSKTLDEFYQKRVDWINDEKYYDRLSLEDELAEWETLSKKYDEGSEERRNADKEIYRVKKEINEKIKQLEKESYQNSVDWINDRKYYNELSLKDELAAWRRVQNRYLIGSEERKNADKEVYRVKKEITEKLEKLDKDYYDKQKEINDKLQNDIKEANDSYNDAVDSRAKTLYDSYGLFDKVEKDQEKVSGTELFTNLNDQVLAMRSWEDELSKLAEKGVSKGLIEELQAMGPKAIDKIKALNTMSESRLDDYVDLWIAKHNIAHNQAVYELDGLRMDTDKTINKLNSDAKIELEKYKQTWIDETKDLRSAVIAEFQSFTDGIKNVLEGQNWKATGLNIINKIVSGIFSAPSGIGQLLSKALNLEDVDNSPVIKPVLDLSNIEAGKKQLNLMTSQGLLAGALVGHAAKQTTKSSLTTNNSDNRTITINNTYNVRDDSDIDTISKDLLGIINRRSNAKGVPAT